MADAFPGIAKLQLGQDGIFTDARLQPGPLSNDAGLEPGAPRWHSRGYLPHFDSHEVIQHVTFHLADSLPAEALARIVEDLRAVPPERQDAERRKRIEAWIDAGHGCCVLQIPAAARCVQDALLFFDGERYRLFAWVIMPNHVHVLFQTMAGWPLPRIVASWKSFTGRRLSPLLPQPVGTDTARRVWHREYWDRFIRDERHFCSAKEYIHNNPVKAGLVRRPEDWMWSSARLALQQVGEEVPGTPAPAQQ